MKMLKDQTIDIFGCASVLVIRELDYILEIDVLLVLPPSIGPLLCLYGIPILPS